MNQAITFYRSIKSLILRMFNPIFKFVKSYTDLLYLKFYGVETERGYVTLKGYPIIQRSEGAKIILGKNVTLVSKSKYNCAGINHKVILAAIRENSILEIKGNFGASGSAIVAMNSII